MILGEACSQLRRMPSNTDPTAACSHNDVIIDIQRNNRTPTNCAQAKQVYPCHIPSKMIRPLMLAGMVQRCDVSSQRIGCLGHGAFKLITPTASKAKIVKLGLAALRFWNQVVYDHRLPSIGLGGLTVRTTVIIGVYQLLTQCVG